MGKYSAARDLDLSNKLRWYVVASRTEAVIYANGPGKDFHFVDRLRNSLGGRREIELVSDRPGRGVSSAAGSIHHALEPRTQKHDHIARKFSKKIGIALERALRQDRFGSIVLVAEPHFLGLLRENLSPGLYNMVVSEIHHHYTGSDEEIKEKIMKASMK